MPQADPQSKLFRRYPRVAALTLSNFISAHGISYVGGINRARKLRNGGASLVILVGTSKDLPLEAVWTKPLNFVNALRRAQVDLVLGPAYSIYVGRPPLERLANRSRNLWLYRFLSDAGIQVVPAIGFVDVVDATRVGEWVAGYGLEAIFIDLQSADSLKSWGTLRKALPAFIACATSIERIVVNGVAQPSRVIELASLTSPVELILTNGCAALLAGAGYDFYPMGDQFVRQQSAARPNQIFENMVRFYEGAAAGRIGQYIPCSNQPWLV